MTANAKRLLELEVMAAPTVEPAQAPMRRLVLMRQMATNVLAAYGPDAYRELNLHGEFLGRRSLVTNDPEIIRKVLVRYPERFQRTDATMRILKPVLGEGLFLSDGNIWKLQRRTMAPAFAPRAMDIVAKVSREVAGETFDMLDDEAGEVDLLEVMQQIALEVAGRTMFSMSMRKRGQRLRSLFEGYGVDVGKVNPLDLLLPRGVPSPTDWRRRRLGQRWLACIDELLRTRAGLGERDGDARDLYDLLAQARDPETGHRFSTRELRDQFATMIVAGHETTALSLLWTALMVSRSAHLQEALFDETCSHCDALHRGRAADLEKLILHRSVIQEALRLFPPAFLIVRELKRPMRLAGRILFKGDVVSISPWLMHRHEQHWTEPDLFDPCRFLPGRVTPSRFVYLPFGAGPRICVGMNFALTEAVAVLAHLISAFRIEPVGEQDIRPIAVVTTYPSPIPRFRLYRRRTRKLAA